MKKDKANDLVQKLIDASFVAGGNSKNMDGLMYNDAAEKATELKYTIVRCLTVEENAGKCNCPHDDCDCQYRDDAGMCNC